MKFIGITGGVGAGKSAVLDYLKSKEEYKVMLADEIAHELMEPGTLCYKKLQEEFKVQDIFKEDGQFDRNKLAAVIFSDERKRDRLNGIVHPAVKEYVKNVLKEEKNKGQISILFLEAALLIEEKYDEICDELWYIYTSENKRRQRLKESRGYSDEKIDNIFASQLTEDEYRRKCKVVIDNNNELDSTMKQIELALQKDKE